MMNTAAPDQLNSSKKSMFNIGYEDGSSLILFNTYSTKIIRLDANEREIWMTNEFERYPEETKDWLKKNHFLTTITDEVGSLVEEYEQYKLKPKTPSFRILTTLACNADCNYCFEKKDPHSNMTKETAIKCVDFISRYITKQQKTISLNWFGGEPLVNTFPIDIITRELKIRYPDKSVVSGMISNGSLFHRYIDRIEDWNLKTVQITLDGTRDNYNKIKRYSSKEFNFDVVLDNIKLLIKKGVKVTIRLNYNDDNIADILLLIDQLNKMFGKRIRLYCSRLFSFISEIRENDNSSEKLLFDKCLALGYLDPKKLIQRKRVPCGFSAFSNHLIITPNGSVCKCVESLFDPNLTTVGTIFDDNLDEKKIEDWSKIIIQDKCSSCCYFPICMGSCKLSQLGHISSQCFRYKDQIPDAIKHISAGTSRKE